jgi:hypothetical protein
MFLNGKTLPYSVPWFESIDQIKTEEYAYNLAATSRIVIDGDDFVTEKQLYCIKWAKKNGQPIFITTEATSKHKRGFHIIVRVGKYKYMSERGICPKVDILGNASGQIVKIKANKYPKDFDVFKDLPYTPFVSDGEVKKLLRYLRSK